MCRRDGCQQKERNFTKKGSGAHWDSNQLLNGKGEYGECTFWVFMLTIKDFQQKTKNEQLVEALIGQL